MSDYSQQLYNGEAAQKEGNVVSYVDIDMNNLAWGLNAITMAAFGLQIYNWFPGWVKSEEEFFPTYVSGTCILDEDWALSTSEIDAWSNAAYWLEIVYGLSSLIWLANATQDNEGGLIHEVFYRTTQALPLVPLVTLVLALNVKKSYAPNNLRFAADVTAAGSSLCR